MVKQRQTQTDMKMNKIRLIKKKKKRIEREANTSCQRYYVFDVFFLIY